MPEITVSETIYRQIEAASGGEDMDHTLARMVYRYQRGNSPGD